MARVLVTGANGFLGSWLLKRLIAENHTCVVLHRKTSDLSEIAGLSFESKLGDVLDYESLKSAVFDCDTVFHLAGLIAYRRSERPMMDKVNVQGTVNVLRACKEQGIRRLVHVSSVVAVGASFDGRVPLNERSNYNLSHLDLGYFETKLKAEICVMNAARDQGLDAVIVNPSTIYGPGDARKGTRRTQLKVAQGRFPFYASGGVNVVDVRDVVDGIVAAWSFGKKGERYILCGENITILQLFRWIATEAGVKPPWILVPRWILQLVGGFGDFLEKFGLRGPMSRENAWTFTLYHWFDSSKARRELGFKPRPAAEAVRQSVHWMKEVGLLGK